MKPHDRQHHLEGNSFAHGSRRRAVPPRSLEAGHEAPPAQGAWRPSEQAQAQPTWHEHEHEGQYGYGMGGEAHDNWGAFDGNPMPQNPGEGQDEPWQHYHDTDYRRWRAEHIRQLDEDYARWRNERFSKFAEEFSQWRDRHAATRPKAPPPSPQRSQSSDATEREGDSASALKGKLK